jgi:hypothetical protein
MNRERPGIHGRIKWDRKHCKSLSLQRNIFRIGFPASLTLLLSRLKTWMTSMIRSTFISGSSFSSWCGGRVVTEEASRLVVNEE